MNGAPLAQVNAGSPEAVTYLHPGHLGTPKFGTNAGGTQVWAWAPDAFGNGSPSGAATVNLRMPGQFYDAESSLFYNWNRYYNPATGRYIGSDPIGLAGGLNTFNYPQNPVMWTDPLGLKVKAIYDKDEGVLTVYDVDNPKLILSAPAFSGTPGIYAGAPNGTYTISDFPWGSSAEENYFALIYHDKNKNDCLEDFPSNYDAKEKMCNLRLHSGELSHGCVTSPNKDGEPTPEWLAIQEMIQNTKKGTPVNINEELYPNFGTLEVTGEGYGAFPEEE